jgi:hypothetical protein
MPQPWIIAMGKKIAPAIRKPQSFSLKQVYRCWHQPGNDTSATNTPTKLAMVAPSDVCPECFATCGRELGRSGEGAPKGDGFLTQAMATGALASLLFLTGWDCSRGRRRQGWRGGFGRGCGASKFRRVRAVSGPKLGPFDRSNELAAHWRFRRCLSECWLLAGFGR